MSKSSIITYLFLTLMIACLLGCSDRGVNSSDLVTSGGEVMIADHICFDEFPLQVRNPFQQFFLRVYIPEVSIVPISGGSTARKVPTLVLLAPQFGSHGFFFKHGLKQLANEMIATGEIQPMAIVCIPNDRVFGGYFYSGHYPGAGNYDTLISFTLLDHLYSILPFLDPDPTKLSIGGVGQGAYGAFRAAMMNPGKFRAISVTDGPLDFDGNDNVATDSGFASMFDDVLDEQGLKGNASWNHKYDSTTLLANMFAGAALAFSPHDTAITYNVEYRNNIITGLPYISNIEITSRDTIADETTLVDSLISPTENSFHFHMPFDQDGAIYQPIWDMWLANNLENMLTSQLDGVSLWFGLNSNAKWGFHQQTESFMSTLGTAGYSYDVKEYIPYDDSYLGTNNEYLYSILRDMLIFHSEAFGE